MRRLIASAVAALVVLTAPEARAAFTDVDIDLELVVSLDQPIAMAVRTADSRLYIAEKAGRVQRVDGGVATEILDISPKVSDSGERGLLGLTFDPAGMRMYVNYTNNDGDTIIRAYTYDGTTVDEDAAVRIIKIKQPFANHNGGNIAFGPDGFLYIGMGDGGDQDDPGNRAQSRDSLLGKMLRIDPAASGGYASPAGNPYVGRKGRDEIWARGLRNPWRWSFDDAGTGNTDDLWIGDVGGSSREEIDHQPASSDGGENYGWRRMEGTQNHIGTEPADHVPPVFDYPHAGSVCAVTGGYLYRGTAITDLVGGYVYADFCVGTIRAFLPSDPDGTDRAIGASEDSIASFGRDATGELYVLSLGGDVSRIVP